MSADLNEMVQRELTPGILGKLSDIVGESSTTISRAASLAVPTILGAIAQRASTEPDARALLDSLHAGGYHAVGTASFVREGPGLVERGQGILTSLFGEGLGTTETTFGNQVGLAPRSSARILAVLAPIVMNVLGRHVAANDLSAADLAALLQGHLQGVAHGAREVVIARASRVRQPSKTWLWTLFALGVVFFGGFFLCSRGRQEYSMGTPEMNEPMEGPIAPAKPSWATPPVGGGPPPVETPAALERPAPRAMGIDDLGSYLDGKTEVSGPARFELKELEFDHASSHLTEEGRATVGRVAEILAKHPNAKVSVEGFTDSTGTTEINQTLSQARAVSVRTELVARGIDGSRIQAVGRGSDTPIASNDTEEGRILNRRTEVIVMSK